MFKVSIKHDLPTVGIFASDVMRRQMPWAVMQTLNSLAYDVKRNTETRVFPSSFNVRNKRFSGLTYSVGKATKTSLVSSVFDRFERANLEQHSVGGTKTPRGRHVAIPSRTLAKRRSGKGVPKNMRPRTALDRPNVFQTTINGQKVIAQRKGRGGKKFEVLYILEPNARIRRTFPMYREADREVRRKVDATFKREFEKAMRTAKPRKTAR